MFATARNSVPGRIYVCYRTHANRDVHLSIETFMPNRATTLSPQERAQAISSGQSPIKNFLIAALPGTDYDRLLPGLEFVAMPLGLSIYESGDTQGFVFFPTTSIVSLLYVMEDGSSAEIAVVGNEGLVGISLFMGGESTTSRAVVQSAGFAYRLRASQLKEEFERGGPLQHLLLRYTQALITQMAQTAVCNRHHAIEQQLCRWLLLSLDRLSGNDLIMTQELIANMLGVRREGVTEAAGRLQADGLIHYSRGKITVLDRPRLEDKVCECYAVVKREYDRLLMKAAVI
jgi:CRP-like cAMP-binding protein